MYLHKILCLLLIAVLAVSSLSAQESNTNSIDSFTAKLITNIRAHAKEQAYLVTDKSIYKAGEYVWFNAFLINTASQKLSNKSKYLFVDVVNENDDIVKRVILDASNLQLNSRIQLPDSLAGDYWLRAYTRQMAATDTGNIAVQPLYVVNSANTFTRPATNKEPKASAPSLTFYPEGNNLITGIDATVAIVASNASGMPLQTTGIIKDNRDTVVTTFSTDANGLGKFTFEPNGFRQYKAVIQDNGAALSYVLPPFDFYKGQLSVTHPAGSYQLRVLLGDSIYHKNSLAYVVGLAKDSLVFAAFGKGLYQVNVDENKLPAGITTFYLFDTTFHLLSERAVYSNGNGVQVNIATNKSSYTKREKVSLTIAVTDALQHPAQALLNVSVSDSLSAGKQVCSSYNVAAIHNVDDIFFAMHSCFSDEEKDLLMLTRNNTYPKLFAPANHPYSATGDSLFYISGSVLNGKTEERNKIVTLISNAGSDGIFYTDTTDNAGHYQFALDSHPDSMQYALQVKDFNNHVQNVEIIPAAFNYPNVKTPAMLKQLPAVSRTVIDKLEREYNYWGEDSTHHLKPVTVKDQKEADYDVSKRVSPFSSIISGNDLDGRTSVDNLILKVGGLQVLNGFLTVRGLFSKDGASAGTEPLIIMDGVQVYISDIDAPNTKSPVLSYLSTLNPKDIDFIEVLKDGSASNYGVRGANGVILINTARKSHTIPAANNMKTFYAKGITSPALFPMVVYNEKDKKTAAVHDVRSTLFWNGHVLTGNDGHADFVFFTSDIPATYTITVTGITAHGDLFYKTTIIKTK